MSLSYENMALLSVKLGRAIDAKTKVSLTGDSLGKLLDAARKEERAKKREPSEFERVADIFFNGQKA